MKLPVTVAPAEGFDGVVVLKPLTAVAGILEPTAWLNEPLTNWLAEVADREVLVACDLKARALADRLVERAADVFAR